MRQLLTSLHLVNHQSPPMQTVRFTHTSRMRIRSHTPRMRISYSSSELGAFSKESQEIEVEFIVITLSVSSSSESLEFFAIVHQVTTSDVIPLAVFDVCPHRKPIYLFFYLWELYIVRLMHCICLLHMMRFLNI